MKAWVTLNAEKYGAAIISRASAGEVSSIRFQPPAPAECTITSGTPWVWRTRLARASTASPSDASQASTCARSPIEPATSSSRSRDRATRITR